MSALRCLCVGYSREVFAWRKAQVSKQITLGLWRSPDRLGYHCPAIMLLLLLLLLLLLSLLFFRVHVLTCSVKTQQKLSVHTRSIKTQTLQVNIQTQTVNSHQNKNSDTASQRSESNSQLTFKTKTPQVSAQTLKKKIKKIKILCRRLRNRLTCQAI